MKIKFDIKYRPQIECGKYKVVNQEGTPVTIERWDLKGNYPILAILPTLISNGDSSWFEDRPYIYVCSKQDAARQVPRRGCSRCKQTAGAPCCGLQSLWTCPSLLCGSQPAMRST